MKFDIITLFPKVCEPYFKESILGRAVKNKLIEVKIHNLREYSRDKKHQKVDDRAYGGGPGMVLQALPVIRAVASVKSKKKIKIKVVVLSAKGKEFTDKLSLSFSKYDQLILVAGHYEGIDERVIKVLKTCLPAGRAEEGSVGQYILSGGELPAMVIVDAVARKIKGVLGKSESLEEHRLGAGVPTYTRPETISYKGKKYSVPKVLLSGHHRDIEEWRLEHKKI